MFRFFIILISSFFFLTAQTAHACSCAQGGYWVSEFVEDKVIFEGKPLLTRWLDEDAKERVFRNNAETTFKITKTFKGRLLAETHIQHHSQGPACGMLYHGK